MHSRSDGDGKCTVSSQQSQTSQTDLTGGKREEAGEEEIAIGATSSESSPDPAPKQEAASPDKVSGEVACSHYVVDLSMDRRDFCINYNNRRHDPRLEPPPPYTERPIITA